MEVWVLCVVGTLLASLALMWRRRAHTDAATSEAPSPAGGQQAGTLAELSERVDALAGAVAATVLVHQHEDRWIKARALDVLKDALARAEGQDHAPAADDAVVSDA